MERCPLCRARLGLKTVCPRCGADLTLAQNAQTAAARRLHRALAALAAGDNLAANGHAQRALRLHRTPFNEAVANWLGNQ